MAKLNVKVADRRKDANVRLAGGMGAAAAVQGDEALLRRAVLGCLLWEDVAYETGEQVAENISALVPKVDAGVVADIAIEARVNQGLRHVPLLLARVMAGLPSHRHVVGALLPEIIRRPDEITEFLAIYNKDAKGGRLPLSKQVKIGLAAAFSRFNEYSLAKWNKDGAFRLRDALFLTHPKPANDEQAALWARLASNTLVTPDTWEVALSAGADKKATWERLITEGKLGGMAFIRNLRNMEQAKVDPKVIRKGLAELNTRWLQPLHLLAAARHAPAWERELSDLMLRSLGSAIKLPGRTILIVDLSGSMGQQISGKSEMTRMDSAMAMAMLAGEVCESVAIYATAGSDGSRTHKTELIRPRRGFAAIDDLRAAHGRLGGGGIYTRQALAYIQNEERETPDRIMVFSDSQDCDRDKSALPRPFGRRNYIVDVSANSRGINYDGVWDAEISGFSPGFLPYIAALEGYGMGESEN